MSGPENFLSRWSRRKQARSEVEQTRPDPQVSPPDEAANKKSEPHADAEANPLPNEAAAHELAFDLSKLPAIESITAETDIRGFLAPGVPAELTRAALRRAWSADPAIRDFVGLAENAWDFNAPDGVPGFGALEMSEEVRRRIIEMVGRSVAEPAREAPSSPPVQTVNVATLEETTVESQSEAEVSPEGPPVRSVASATPVSQHSDAALQESSSAGASAK